ncbi:MAG TPA: DUF6249 domain-containing protein, partial [Cellvibrio sp.]|nr:DUF6249 domain-containing protein [Cellvibrio sp.]
PGCVTTFNGADFKIAAAPYDHEDFVMELITSRMFHPGLINRVGLLLCLLLAMQVWAEDSQAPNVAPPSSSSPAPDAPPVLTPIPREPMAVPAIPDHPAGHGTSEEALERHIAEQISRNIEQEFGNAFGSGDNLSTALLIPLFAIVFTFGGPIILIIALMMMHYRARARRERQQSENIAQLLAAGKDVPLELLRGDEASSAVAEDNLRKGVKNIGIGTGLLIFLTLFLGIGIGSVGFIMIGLGISQLVVWKLADNKTAQHKPQD